MAGRLHNYDENVTSLLYVTLSSYTVSLLQHPLLLFDNRPHLHATGTHACIPIVIHVRYVPMK